VNITHHSSPKRSHIRASMFSLSGARRKARLDEPSRRSSDAPADDRSSICHIALIGFR
jgi:hypothetical protein